MYSKLNYTRDFQPFFLNIENKIIMFNQFIVSNYLKLYPKIEQLITITNDFLERYFFEMYSLFVIVITLLFITVILYYSNLYQVLLRYKNKHIMSLSLDLDKYRKYIIQLQNKNKELEFDIMIKEREYTELKYGMKKRKLDSIKEISENSISENNPILIHPHPRRRISLIESKKEKVLIQPKRYRKSSH